MLPPGSAPGAGEGADGTTQDLRIHLAAVAERLTDGVVSAACAPRPELTDVLAARRYPDRWVLVVMTARKAFKVVTPPASFNEARAGMPWKIFVGALWLIFSEWLQ